VVAQSDNIAQVDSEAFRDRLKLAAGGPLTTWLDGLGLKDTVYSALSRKSVPGPEVLVRLSRASGRSIDWLLGLVDTSTSSPSLDGPRLPIATSKGLRQALAGKVIRTPEELQSLIGEPGSPGATRLSTDSPIPPYIEGDSEFVFVRRYDVRAAGGKGEFISDENVIGRYAYQREWWERNMRTAASKCAIIDYVGDSMEPDLHDGEPLMIDLSDNGMAADAVYVFRLDERLLVKRLQWLPGDLINVHSSNARYPAYQVSMEALQSPERGGIIGRVLGVPGEFRWIK